MMDILTLVDLRNNLRVMKVRVAAAQIVAAQTGAKLWPMA